MNKLVVCLSGFSNEEKQKLETLIKSLEGVFEANLTKSAGVLVVGKTATPKYWSALNYLKIPVVRAQWLKDSARRKKFLKNYTFYKPKLFFNLHIGTYKVPRKTQQIIKKHGGILNSDEKGCFDYIVTTKQHFRTLKLISDKCSLISTDWIHRSVKFKKLLSPQDFENVSETETEQLTHLDKYLFYIDGYSEEDKNLIVELINTGGGSYLDKLLPCVTHVISPFKSFRNKRTVTKEWLQNVCINN